MSRLKTVLAVTIAVVLMLASGCDPVRNDDAAFVQHAAPLKPDPAEFAKATEAWRWVMPAQAEPLLMTALGDVFVRSNDGSVLFLDTESGELTSIARNEEEWRKLLQRADLVERWFRPSFVAQLKERHGPLTSPHVYSPTIPLVLDGKLTVENYTPSRWDAHLHVMGQIHRQVKDLPPGTPVTKINVEPWK